MQDGNRRAILAALAANLGIAIAKFVGYAATGSASLLAEAVHSVADTGNQALLLWGAAAASRPESASRPFGHGRERYFYAFIGALVMSVMPVVVALMLVSGPGSSQQEGLIGGILGAVIGTGGAVFGVTMSVRRMRINRLLNELNRS